MSDHLNGLRIDKKMNEYVYYYLYTNKPLLNFVRHHPIWYRYLSRDPERVHELEREAKIFYGQTFTQRLEKVNEHVQLVQMLAEISKLTKD